MPNERRVIRLGGGAGIVFFDLGGTGWVRFFSARGMFSLHGQAIFFDLLADDLGFFLESGGTTDEVEVGHRHPSVGGTSSPVGHGLSPPGGMHSG